jgi:hypothetical protein
MNTLSSSENFVGMAGICLDRLLKQRSALHEPGEVGTKNFAGKSESRNSKSETPKNGKGEKKQFGLRRFKLFPRSDFYLVSRFELRISNLEIWCILREISPVSDSRHG